MGEESLDSKTLNPSDIKSPKDKVIGENYDSDSLQGTAASGSLFTAGGFGFHADPPAIGLVVAAYRRARVDPVGFGR